MGEFKKKFNIDDEVLEAYVLDNAISHKGKSAVGPVLNALFIEGLKKEDIKEAIPMIQNVVNTINAWTLEQQQVKYEELKELKSEREVKEGLPELPDSDKIKKVVMRFAPYPSGPIHIGNTRQLILNDEYVKKYGGKMILFMDDTIGSDKKYIEPEAYKLIPESVKWLGVDYDKKILYKSDRLEIYYKYAEELLKKGYMYVCSCSQEDFMELKKNQQECSCRHLPIEEQLQRWKLMFKSNPGEYVVRLKTSMQDKDPAFRDRVMFRISNREHPKVKKKYSIWPSLEFSWAIDDHLIGSTHIIRGMDLIMESRVESFIWDIFGWEKPMLIHTGFFQIEGVKISKSKGADEVRSGQYLGWNDPRLWSLQSLKDRGIQPEAIREFCKGMGLRKNNATIAVDVLYDINKKILEAKPTPRYFFVSDPIKIRVKVAPRIKAKIPLHPEKDIGERSYTTEQQFYISNNDYVNFTPGIYRFMHLFNFDVSEVKYSRELEYRFHSEEVDKNLKPKYLQWVSADNDYWRVDVVMPDGSVVSGIGEEALGELKKGKIIQFERFGFVCLYEIDKKDKRMKFLFAHE
jgi:glutamyl-tRNA synthetase